MITIFRKELKDVVRWTPLGMIVIGLLCWQQVPKYLNECSQLPTSLASMVIIGSGLFALVLGLLQSLFDQRTDSRAFLLHRPISVKDIYRGKLAAGFVAHTIAWAVPLLVMAILEVTSRLQRRSDSPGWAATFWQRWSERSVCRTS